MPRSSLRASATPPLSRSPLIVSGKNRAAVVAFRSSSLIRILINIHIYILSRSIPGGGSIPRYDTGGCSIDPARPCRVYCASDQFYFDRVMPPYYSITLEVYRTGDDLIPGSV